ncbi:hypothetical protein PBI_SCTP2_415 [Salicola phage SCTP-2]|nr:hypothetical protein PBI_SCTP2_415 [Salicola phage SCTP-2]
MINTFKCNSNEWIHNKKYNSWRHRTKRKIIFNPILRFVQGYPFNKRPFIIASICDNKNGRPFHTG